MSHIDLDMNIAYADSISISPIRGIYNHSIKYCLLGGPLDRLIIDEYCNYNNLNAE